MGKANESCSNTAPLTAAAVERGGGGCHANEPVMLISILLVADNTAAANTVELSETQQPQDLQPATNPGPRLFCSLFGAQVVVCCHGLLRAAIIHGFPLRRWF